MIQSIHGPGLLTVTDSGGIELLDPTTGTAIADVQPPTTTIIGDTNPCTSGDSNRGISQLTYRESYNAGFTEAVWVSQPEPDGSQHVGFQDASGRVTDVTAKTLSQSFGTEPPQDQSPVFDPATDDLYFLRASTTNSDGGHAYVIYRYDPSSQQVNILGHYETQDTLGDDAPDYITIQHGVVVLGDYRISPDGTAAASGESGEVAVLPVSGQVLHEPSDDSTEQTPGAALPGGAGNGIEVFAWAGNRAIIASINQYGGNSSDLYRMPIHGLTKDVYTVKPIDLLPANSNDNEDAVVSPDGKSMAFTGTQGSVTTLYRSSATSRSTPEAVGTGTFDGCLLAWQS